MPVAAPPLAEAPPARVLYEAGPAPVAYGPPAKAAPYEVICPSCHAGTQIAAGLHAICFSCGQPIPAQLVAQASGAPVPPPVVAVVAAPPPRFPLTAAIAEGDLAPPANPYGAAYGVRLAGPSGSYQIGEVELRVGRDPGHCAIVLSEPRVSGVHATLKFERMQLFVRDEGSNNGTFVDGARIVPREWVPVRLGASLRFGPEEFSVRRE